MSALSDLRILELSSGVAGEYCGKLLADFGAQVIKVESPGTGSQTRDNGTVRSRRRDPRKQWLVRLSEYQQAIRRPGSVNSRGQEALRTLIRRVDVVIDDHPKGYLEDLGIAPATCSSQHPRLIVCSITPFGYDAPRHAADRAQRECASQQLGISFPRRADPGKPPLNGAGRFLPDYESGLSAALAIAAGRVLAGELRPRTVHRRFATGIDGVAWWTMFSVRWWREPWRSAPGDKPTISADRRRSSSAGTGMSICGCPSPDTGTACGP